MANTVYPLWLKYLWDLSFNLASANPAGNLRVALVTNAYTYSASHEFYSSISGVLGTKDISTGSIVTTAGVLDAEDPLVTGLSAGEINAAILHWWTGVAGTSRLLLYIDDGQQFDITPVGDVLVRWSNVAGVMIFPLGGVTVS